MKIKNGLKYYSLAFYLLLLMCLMGCSPYTSQTLFKSNYVIDIDTLRSVYVHNDQRQTDIYYTIKINDQIAIRNLQSREWGTSTSANSQNANLMESSENPTTYRIDDDGTANLPIVGKVKLAGLTRREATQKLQELYSAPEYLKNPIIDLKITNLKVNLYGEFNTQGSFLLENDNTTLMDMVAKAGGFTKNADPRSVKIIRGNKNNPEEIYVNMTNLNSLKSRKLILQNNDIIYVDQTKNAVITDRLQKSNNIIQPLLVVVNLAVLIFTLTK
ncbi:MAG: hypothetical protein EOO99_10470 [Pedobacter sp.]|nr:MAG: hypothetical protein EOO99_10470 [Pedobacter sp.]